MTTIDKNILRKAVRAASSPLRLLPDFMIIGTQKGGSTSLYNYLIDHPNIAPIFVKEPHFFDFNFYRGVSWYRAHFPSLLEKYYAERIRGQKFITGEASPYYLYYPLTPRRIKETMPTPNTKFIVLLRNPIDRAYSHYQHETRQPGVEPFPFAEAIEHEAERLSGEEEKIRNDIRYYSFNLRHYAYLARGRYVEQLQVWLKLFPREQFLILKSEDLYENPPTVLKQTLEFLEVPHQVLKEKKEEYEQYNKAHYEKMNAQTRARLVEYFKPYNERLYEFLGRDFGWNK